MKRIRFILLIITAISLTVKVDCQTLHIASGQSFITKSENSTDNTKSIPIFIGIDYLQKDWFYLTTNFGYQNRDYQIDNTLKANYLTANTAFDFYFVKDYSVRPFLGFGLHISYLLSDNLDEFDSADNLELYQSPYGILLRYGARQKFNRFEIALIGDVSNNINGQGKHGDSEIKGHSKTFMLYLGIPINTK